MPVDKRATRCTGPVVLERITGRYGGTQHPRCMPVQEIKSTKTGTNAFTRSSVDCMCHATPLTKSASFSLFSVLQLLAELNTYAPSVLGQQAAHVPAADAAQWLKWWKDPRSWSAGYTFQQWLQVGGWGAAEGMPHGVLSLCCAYAVQLATSDGRAYGHTKRVSAGICRAWLVAHVLCKPWQRALVCAAALTMLLPCLPRRTTVLQVAQHAGQQSQPPPAGQLGPEHQDSQGQGLPT